MIGPRTAARKVWEPRNRRRVLSVADQAASSVTNVLAAVLVARSLDAPEAFGAYGLAMVAYQIALGLNRAVVGEPFLALHSDESADTRKQLLPDILATTAAVAVGASFFLAAIGRLLSGLSGEALSALALVLPLVLLHDTWRFYFIIDRAGISLLIDVVWLIGVIGAYFLVPSGAGIGWFITAWALGGAVGAAVATVLAGRIRGRPRPAYWVARHKAFCGSMLGEFVTSNAVSNLVMAALAPIGGLRALASARASQIFYGPQFMLYGGITLALVPEGVRNRKRPARLRRMLMVTSSGLAAFSGLWMVAGLLTPAWLGEVLLNENWQGARDLMIPFGVGMMATGFASGGRTGLRSLGDARRLFTTRLAITPWQVICPLAGAFLGGAVGFGIGFAMGRIATAIIYWRALTTSLQAVRPDTSENSTPASESHLSPETL